MKTRLLLICAAAALLSGCGTGETIRDPKLLAPEQLPKKWSQETIAAWEKLPIFDGGRAKPFYTFAKYELLRTRGYPTLRLKIDGKDPESEDGKPRRDLSAVAWLLDCMFHPEMARNYSVFNVDDAQIIEKVGLKAHPLRRDQYSYNELVLARDKFAQAQAEHEKQQTDAKNGGPEPDRLTAQTANIARNLGAYEHLIHALDAVRLGIYVPANNPAPGLATYRGTFMPTSVGLEKLANSDSWRTVLLRLQAAGQGGVENGLMSVLQILKGSKAYLDNAPKDMNDPQALGNAIGAYFEENKTALEANPDLGLIMNIAPYLLMQSFAGSRIAIVPPLHKDGKWNFYGGLITSALEGKDLEKSLATLRKAEELCANPANADKAALELATLLTAGSANDPRVEKIQAELAYQKWNLFAMAKWAFVLLFLCAAASWIAPQARWSRILSRGIWWLALLGVLAIVFNIGWRIYIGTWAPVTTLYETIPFITLVAVLMALFVEKFFKNGIGLGVATALGAFGLFVTGAFEAAEASDTKAPLEAVLRNGFWLWTHVQAVTIGYACVILAGVFSMVYVFARVFDLKRVNHARFKMLTSASYGILCFALFFVLLGTILGGIWANYSWGRFWGWDPKENGALIITLWVIAVLHLRLSGWIKEFGFHLWTILGILTVIFSWWHVNELGIGLHSYGKTEGRMFWICIGYGVVVSVFLFGLLLRGLIAWQTRHPAESTQSLPAQPSKA